MNKSPNYRELLKGEWQLRLGKNPAYSLRAFARDLKLTAPQLSEVLSGKRGLSRDRALTLTSRLAWSAELSSRFCDLVEMEHGRSVTARALAKHRVENAPVVEEALRLTADSFRTVSDWYHFAILAALKIPSLKGSELNLAAHFSLSSKVVAEALARMERLGLVEKRKQKWEVMKNAVFSPDGVPSEAVRNAHEQLLKRAGDALYLQPMNERDFFSYILPIAGTDLPEIASRYRKFIVEIRDEFGNKPNVDRVVNIGNQIFSLSQSTDVSVQKEVKP